MRYTVLIVLAIIALGCKAQSDSVRAKPNNKKAENRMFHKIDSAREIARSRLMKDDRFRYADSLLTLREERARSKYDTSYITKPDITWTVKLRYNLSGNDLTVRSKTPDGDGTADLKAAHKSTLAMSIGFRGITMGFALNPRKWFGINKDFEFNLNTYTNKYGFDAIITNANTFSGSIDIGKNKYPVNAGEVKQVMYTVNGYYAFNSRRFSYPAAFTQSQIQRRSAGSWLLSAMFIGGSINFSENAAIHTKKVKLHTGSLGIGGGYAYNLVLPHRWLIHASVTPEIVVLTHSRLWENGERIKMPYHFPNFMTVGRFAVLRNWDKHYFAGASAVINYADTGDYDNLRIFQMKWMARAFVGIRL